MKYTIEDTPSGFRLTVGGRGNPRRVFDQRRSGSLAQLYREAVKTANDLRTQARAEEAS